MRQEPKRSRPATQDADDTDWDTVGDEYRRRAAGPVLSAASIPTERVRWIWPGRIAAGTIVMVDGDPGLGKSTLLADLIARRSRGEALPGDATSLPAAGAVIVSFEDAPGAVIKPRLVAAGAVLERVAIWDLDHVPFSLPGSLAALEEAVVACGAELVVIDPIMAALSSDVNANRDQDVRRVLSSVAAMAQRTRAAVVLVRHLNKSAGPRAIYRGGGSIGIVGAARSALLVERDPEDDDARVLAVVKCNLGREAQALRFRILPEIIEDDGIETSRLEWLGTVETSADELVADPAEATAVEQATRWLAMALSGGPRPANDLFDAAHTAGISVRTLKRAKKKLGAVSERESVKGIWIWSLVQKTTSL